MRHYDVVFESYQKGVDYYKSLGFRFDDNKRLVRYNKEAVITKNMGQYFGYIKSLSDES